MSQEVPSKSVFEYNGALYICGPQQGNQDFGMVHDLYDFDEGTFGETRDVAAATLLGPLKVIERLKMNLLLHGRAAQYNLLLENKCLLKQLQTSQKLNHVCST